jgi:type IV secretion system protein VirB9
MNWPGFLLGAAMALAGSPAAAADPHIQSVFYQSDAVVELKGAVGWQMIIEFGADERIENVAIGDSTAWQVAPNKRARMLFLKPLNAKASTNMAVITTARQYAFNLSVAPRQASTPWIVRFQYPPPPVKIVPEAPPAPPVNLDFAYTLAGDAALMPTRVWDDGRQTYFEFGEDTAMPAIFAGGPKDDENIVNVTVRGRIAVVQQRAARFTLRAGKRIATVTKQP